MPTKNVNLTDHYSAFVDHLITSGRFRNSSEVVRAGLRLLEQSTAEEEQKLALLRELAAEGFQQLDQGEGVEFSDRARLAAHIAKLGRRASNTVRGRETG